MTLVNSYELGNVVRLSVTATQLGQAIDPGTVALDVVNPRGVLTSYTYAALQIQRDSLGSYHYDLDPEIVGTWSYRWYSTGAGKGSASNSLIVTVPAAP